MSQIQKMNRIDFNEARAQIETILIHHVRTLRKFYALIDASMTRYGEENEAGLNLVGIYDKDLSNFTGLAHVGLMMPRARFKIRYSKEQNKLDLEVGVLLNEYGRDDDRQDPFERMRMEVMFDPESTVPYFKIRRFETELNPVTGRESVRPVDQGLDLLLQSIADRLGVPRSRVVKSDIKRPKHMTS